MMAKGFDRIAPIYDLIARLVFGNQIVKAQLHFLTKIPIGGHVLILGGGTGWLLRSLMKINPSCRVCYIDASSKMIKRSKEKTKASERIQFIVGTEENIPCGERFDAVITNFYLDLFAEPKLVKVIDHINTFLSNDGSWLVTDFRNEGKWWQSALLRVMYFFFKSTTGLQANYLLCFDRYLKEAGLVKVECKAFYAGFIDACNYRKSTYLRPNSPK